MKNSTETYEAYAIEALELMVDDKLREAVAVKALTIATAQVFATLALAAATEAAGRRP